MSLVRCLSVSLILAALPLVSQEPPARQRRPNAPRPPQARPAPRAEAAPMMERMAKRLKLTEEQKGKLKDVFAKHQEAMKGRVQAAGEARKALQQAMGQAETPVEQLKKLHQTASDRQLDLLLAQKEHRDEVGRLLTPEQRTQWERMRVFEAGRMAGLRQGTGPGRMGAGQGRMGAGSGMGPGMRRGPEGGARR